MEKSGDISQVPTRSPTRTYIFANRVEPFANGKKSCHPAYGGNVAKKERSRSWFSFSADMSMSTSKPGANPTVSFSRQSGSAK